MISVVFVIGMLNLVLGFALAVLLERQIVVPYPVFSRSTRARDVVFELPANQPISAAEVHENMPKRWLDLLETNGIEFSTFVEASVEILKLEVDSYCDDLLDIEDLVRSSIRKHKREAIHDALQVLVALNEEWADHQNDALQAMASSRNSLGQYAAIGNQLESMLLDQTSLVQKQCRRLLGLDVSDADTASAAIISGIGHLVCMAHGLRDAIRNATLLIICNEGRLEETDRRLCQDAMTGLQNRMGVELIFKNWWREDKQRHRLASAALVDVDRFGELNSQVSTRVGDRMLKAIAIYLEQLTDTESGLERVFRFDGQTFFIFFGDAGPRTAASKVEKIRQTIEATKLEHDGQPYAITIRAGVTDVRKEDNTATLFERLEAVIDEAKHAGRNRTGLDDSSGRLILQPEPMEIKQRIVRVE